jgi:hypothetical protein
VPDPVASYEEARRFSHEDLAGRSIDEIQLELNVLRLGRQFRLASGLWFRQRIARLVGALRRGR